MDALKLDRNAHPESPPAARRLILPLTKLFFAVAAGLAVYEALQTLAFPHITIWGSHAVTIGAGGVAAVVAGYLVMQRQFRALARANTEVRQREQTEETLRESEYRYRTLFERNLAGVIRTTTDGRILECNLSMAKILGYDSPQGIPNRRVQELYFSEEERAKVLEKLRADGRLTNFEMRLRRQDGSPAWTLANVSLVPQAAAGSPIIEGTHVDITPLKRALQQLQRTNRAFRTISACNQIIVRAGEESALLGDICQVLVQEGEYRMAWVGYVEHDVAKSVRPVAHFGFEEGYTQTLNITWADTERGRGPAGAAVRTGNAVVARNIQDDPTFALWRDAALKRGYASAIALPLFMNDQVLGALTIYAQEPDAFDAAEIELLTELSNDLAFGIQGLRTRAERKRAEEAHAYLAAIVESSDDAIIGKNLEGIIQSWNRGAEELYGYAASEVIGKSLSLIIPPERQKELPALLNRINNGEVIHYHEAARVTKDGRHVEVSVAISPLRNASGEVIGASTIVRDITEHKRAEKALDESEERFRSLVENATVGIYRTTPQGRILMANPTLVRLLGYESFEELAARNLEQEGFEPNYPRRIFRERMEQDGEVRDLEEAWTRRDGSVIFVRESARAIRGDDGNVLYYDGIVEDITDRKRAEEDKTLLATAVEQSAEAVIITNSTGDIEYVNPAFMRITGYSHEEMMGRNPRILKSGEQGPEFYERLWATILNGEIWQGELTNRRKDGKLYTEQMTITPVRGTNGELTHFIATKQDVTARKQLEQQFIQAQKMEAVGRLAGGVAHDFNNLLTIINGYAQLLTERSSAEDPRRGLFEEILKAGERAASLTRQLLAFSRRQVLEPRVLDLSTVVVDIEKMLRRLIGEDIELVAALTTGLGRVKVDPGQIEQVVMNLAINARDAMPEGGKLFIETSNIDVDEDYARLRPPISPGKYVMVAVSDTGCGMDRETQAHIFEPFFTTKEKSGGTGLGLATVYGIIKQSGGFIWVYSEPGHGSTFKIYFPCVEEEADAAEPPKVATEPVKGSETVLVAEDEVGVRSLVCETLTSHGYKVLEAAGATEALQIAEQQTEPIHLLLTDVVMPQSGGKVLAKHLSSLHPETKVLYMSGYTDDAIVHHGILQSGMSLLQKPFAPNTLLQKVREVLDMKMGRQQ